MIESLRDQGTLFLCQIEDAINSTPLLRPEQLAFDNEDMVRWKSYNKYLHDYHTHLVDREDQLV